MDLDEKDKLFELFSSYDCFVYPLRPALDCCQLLPRRTLEPYVTFRAALWVLESFYREQAYANTLPCLN